MDEKTLRETLWANVSARMRALWGKENLTKLRTAAGVGSSAVSDIQEKRRSVGLDVVEKIAVVLEVQPWQLLHPEGAPMGPSVALSDDVLDLAVQINEIVNHDPDERRRKWAFAMLNLAVTPPPKSPGQTAELMLRLLQESPTT